MNSRERLGRSVTICAGLAIAPVAWATNMQLGQILPYIDCTTRVKVSAAVSISALCFSVLSGGLSWRAGGHTGRGDSGAQTFRFIGFVSALAAAVFCFALALQTVASLVLNGCQR